jgi:hypothetical protein
MSKIPEVHDNPAFESLVAPCDLNPVLKSQIYCHVEIFVTGLVFVKNDPVLVI